MKDFRNIQEQEESSQCLFLNKKELTANLRQILSLFIVATQITFNFKVHLLTILIIVKVYYNSFVLT